MSQINNRDCYWCMPTLEDTYLCKLQNESNDLCETDKPCRRYVRFQQIANYMRELIAENNRLYELLALYEEGLM